jgi:hypothetical protein
MTKLHAGSGIPHGHLNRGTAPKPPKIHVGSGRPLGATHKGTAAPSRRTTSWHTQAARSQKTKIGV